MLTRHPECDLATRGSLAPREGTKLLQSQGASRLHYATLPAWFDRGRA